MQGIVVGTYFDELEKTKINSPFWVDEAFGTVLNRFIAEARFDCPLTVYGKGEHKRPFLMLNDSLQAIEIAIKNRPEEKGKVRVWNQLSEWASINEMAEWVKEIVKKVDDKEVKINHIDTPRKEQTSAHFYKYKTDILKSLGYSPTRNIKDELEFTYNMLKKSDIVLSEKDFMPKIKFRRG